MYNGYQELNALPPEAFLDWQAFVTENDHLPSAGYADAQYAKGLKLGKESRSIHIAVNGTWSAEAQGNGTTFSCEGIGYHSRTAELLHGFIDSGCPIFVHRWSDAGITTTQIK